MSYEKVQSDESVADYEEEQAVLAQIAAFDRAEELAELVEKFGANYEQYDYLKYVVGDYVVWRAGLADGSYIAEKVTKVTLHQYISVNGGQVGLPAEKFRPATVEEITNYNA